MNEKSIKGGSAPGADRTHNLRIRSPALCPLSYGGNAPDYTQKQKIKNKPLVQKAREILPILGDREIGPTFLEAIKKLIEEKRPAAAEIHLSKHAQAEIRGSLNLKKTMS